MNKIVATIEARMTSNRLPGKVLLPALGLPILAHLISRLKSVESIDDIIIATTVNDADQPIVNFAKENGIHYFRGSEDDVMARVMGAAEFMKADIVVEITGDCPIIDPDIVEQTIQMYLHNHVDYVSNGHIRSYPDGMDTQVFSLELLNKSASMTNNQLDHEHVTLHIRNNPEIFSHLHLIAPPSLYWPELGLTLDEESDYQLLKKIIEALAPTDPFFSCHDVINFLRSFPNLLEINKAVVRKGDS